MSVVENHMVDRWPLVPRDVHSCHIADQRSARISKPTYVVKPAKRLWFGVLTECPRSYVTTSAEEQSAGKVPLNSQETSSSATRTSCTTSDWNFQSGKKKMRADLRLRSRNSQTSRYSPAFSGATQHLTSSGYPGQISQPCHG